MQAVQARRMPKVPAFRPRRGRANSAEQGFAYAKACGIISKSFTGKQISPLAKVKSLNELDRLVFPGVNRELPGRELLTDIEKRILQRTTKHILAIINSFDNPPELLVRQLRSCEYADLKNCLHHIAAGKPAPSSLSDIGRFRTVRFEAYPDLAAMLAGSEFEFLLAKDLDDLKSPGFDMAALETKMDLHYYTLLTGSVRQIPAEDRGFIEQLLTEEISLRNCVWALRLRTYFEKKPGEAVQHLMDIKMHYSGDTPRRTTASAFEGSGFGRKISLAAEARAMLHFPLDYRPAWKGWRWESLLNPTGENELWSASPRYFQNAASQYIYRRAMRFFRLLPASLTAIFCFIKLKQFEEDLLTSITEGMALGMSGDDVFGLIEVNK